MRGAAIARAGRRWTRRAALAAALSLAALAPAMAQDLGLPDSPILVIDPNRLFAETTFGKHVDAQIQDQGNALATENRRIEAELAAEEKALTEERPGMEPQAFRDKADAFDTKVTRIRSEQEAKAQKLAKERDNAQRRFLSVARPVLEELMVESGAAALLDTRSVLLSSKTVDVTDEAVQRIDQAIGTGEGLDPPQPSPAPQPDAPAPSTPPQE